MVNKFHERLQYVARLKKIDQSGIAVGLDVDPSTVNRWWRGRVVPREASIRHLSELLECSYQYLATGEGNPDNISHQQVNNVPPPRRMETKIPGYEKVVMTIEPGPARRRNKVQPEAQRQERQTPTRSTDSQPSTTEMLVMTTKVLEPGTIYRPALSSNIRAFYQAVLNGEKGIADRGDQTSDSDLLIMTSKVLDSATIYRSALVSNILAFHQAVLGEEEMMILSEKVEEQNRQIATLSEQVAELTRQLRQLLPGKKRDAAAGGEA
jgi:transcriptional regulator with XRE-family HTH domain